MTYAETIQAIERNARALPSVKSFYYGSVLRLNQERNWQYPAVVLSPRVTTMANGLYQFGFVLWYIDILSKERSEFQEIQSEAIHALTNIALSTDSEGGDPAVTYAPISVFTERFTDICAGAMCDLTITTKAPVCPPSNL